MWTCAEINKIPLLIERQMCILRQILNKLHLIGLVLLPHERQSFLAGQLKSLQRQALLDDLLHFLFNGVQFFLRKGLFSVEIVVEPIVNSRTDGQFRLWIQPLDRLG